MATVPILDYVNSLPLDTARDADSVIYGTNAGGDTKIPCNKLVSEWSATHQYGAGESTVTPTGVFYYALQANSNRDPTDPANAAYWQPSLGSGSGSVGNENYLSNPLWDANLSGWVASGNCSIAYSTGRNIYDGGALAITKTAGATGTVTGDLSEIMATQVGKAWVLKVYDWIDAGATLSAGDIYFELFDGTTTMAIAGSSILLNQLVNQSYPVWPTNVIGSTWKLRIQFKASAVCTMRIADVSVAPQVGQSVPNRSGWIPYPSTPVLVGFGTPTINQAEYAWDGEEMEIDMEFVSGVSTSVEARIPLPLIGVTAKTSPAIKVVGFAARTSTGDAALYILAEAGKEYLTIGSQSASLAGLTKQLATNIAASGITVSIKARVSIAQAVSPIQVSGEDTIYLSNTDATNADNTADANTYYGIEGSPVPLIATTPKAKYVMHRVLQPGETLRLEFRNAATGAWLDAGSLIYSPVASVFMGVIMPTYFAGTTAQRCGVGILSINTTHSTIIFNTFASYEAGVNYTWASFAAIYDRYRVRISKGGAGAEVPPLVVVTVFLTSSQAVTASNPIPYTGVTEDSHGCWNASTYRFTCKVAGRYKISGVANNTATTVSYYVWKNGANHMMVGSQIYTFNGTLNGEITLIAGDYIDIRGGTSATIIGSSTLATSQTVLQITRIGS
jgi:hypothetical protein